MLFFYEHGYQVRMNIVAMHYKARLILVANSELLQLISVG